MKRVIIFLLILCSVFSTKAQTVTYTPQTAAGYQFKYVKIDSGVVFTPGDTLLSHSPNIGGQIKFKSSNKLFYYYDGTKWKPLSIDTSGFAPLLNGKVDSLSISGSILFYWKNGVAYGLTIPSATNIYNTDGVLTGTRTLQGGSYNLNFTGINTFASITKVIRQYIYDTGFSVSSKPVFVADGYSTQINSYGEKGTTLYDNKGIHEITSSANGEQGYFLQIDSLKSVARRKYSVPYIADSTSGETHLGSPAFMASVLQPYMPSAWKLTGNSGTTPGTNFIGTTDAQDLVFKINNTKSGIIDSARQVTAFGFKSLKAWTTGMNNTAFGNNTLPLITTAIQNDAFGQGALFANTTGSTNEAFGSGALAVNTTGNNNLGVGTGSLQSNATGSHNTALGQSALAGVVGGSNNVGVGENAGYYNNGSNRIYINSLDRLSALGDTTKSPVYVLQDTSMSAQVVTFNGGIKLPWLPAGASTDSALVYNTTTKFVGYKAFPTSGGGATNIYNTDGILTGNRTVDMGVYNLDFINGGNLSITASSTTITGTLNSVLNTYATGGYGIAVNNTLNANIEKVSALDSAHVTGLHTENYFNTKYKLAGDSINRITGYSTQADRIRDSSLLQTAIATKGTGTIGGSIAVNQIAFGSGTNAIQGSSNFTYDGATFTSKSSGALFGTTKQFQIQTDYGGSGALLSGSLFSGVGTTGNLSVAPSADAGLSTAGLSLAYFDASFGWRAALNYTNTAGGFGNLNLMTAGGTITTNLSSGMVKSSSGVLATAIAGTDYAAPTSAKAILTAQTAAVSSVTTFTPAADGLYSVGGGLTVTAVSADVINLQVTYTDETNTARTQTFFPMGATSPSVSAVGVQPFSPLIISIKGGTAITVKTVLTTGVGSITYNVYGAIQPI